MATLNFSRLQPKWFAVYTRSRAEKKLYTLLTQKRIECFLPLKKTLSIRSDRKKWIELPLLPCYVFVKITEAEHFAVLNTPGAVCYVSFDGQAVSIPDEQINYLSRFIINNNQDIEVHYCSFEEGDLVEVSAGPLQGIKGEIIEVRGKQRLLLRFSSLGCCIHAEVSSGELSREQRISAVRSAKSETTMS